MQNRFSPRVPSPAMVVACLSLFVALGGTGYAASQFSQRSAGSAIAKKHKKKPKTPGDLTSDTALINKLAPKLSVARSGTAIRAANASNANYATSAGSAPPSGSAGGSLTGSYPNPTIAAGAVTPSMMGSVPAAVVTNSGDVSVPSGSETVLSFDTDVVNIGGVHSTTKNPSELAAPLDGLYEVHGQANWSACGTTPGFVEIQIYVNDFASRVGVTATPTNGGACGAQSVNALVPLHAGDYVMLVARQDTASAATILGANSEHAPDTPEFDMHWVGPAS